ncbi:MAG: putative glycoside hydrolase [Candidatus Magasanikbacteria bacterium]|nr:putative glycoside hydrolase [Candidatus Magasanikbacteria bacterium]
MLTSRNYILISVLAALLGAGAILFQWQAANSETSYATPSVFSPLAFLLENKPKAKPPAQTAKGLYLTAYSASDPKKLDEIIKLIDETELNAVIIDIKDYTGYILYKSRVPLAKKNGLSRNLLPDLPGIIKKLHDKNIYVIARQTVFQDPVLAAKKPGWAIKDKDNLVWRDHRGLSWVDPTRREVWKYNFDIAREVADFGFDEINFDYVRFPSDGDMSRVVYNMGGRAKSQIMREFYQTLSSELANEPVWLSLDMFGLTMEAKNNFDLNIGQRIVDAVSSTDYISPMMYPSHYPRGHLGFQNPAAHPGEVFAHGLKLGMPKFTGQRAKLRPWIQAFNLGAVYDAVKIRAQIDEIEKYTDAGWLMWNASNRYTSAGLLPE